MWGGPSRASYASPLPVHGRQRAGTKQGGHARSFVFNFFFFAPLGVGMGAGEGWALGWGWGREGSRVGSQQKESMGFVRASPSPKINECPFWKKERTDWEREAKNNSEKTCSSSSNV